MKKLTKRTYNKESSRNSGAKNPMNEMKNGVERAKHRIDQTEQESVIYKIETLKISSQKRTKKK